MAVRGKTMIDPSLHGWDDELTTLQCAQAAGINRRTVVEWIQRQILPARRRPGVRGHYRIRWGDFYEVVNTPAWVKPVASETAVDG